jgi:hypothetical protein
MIRVKCPKCASPVSVADADAGGVGSCPRCGQKFRVPTSKPPPMTPPSGRARPSGSHATAPTTQRTPRPPAATAPARSPVAGPTPSDPAYAEDGEPALSAQERRRKPEAVPEDQAEDRPERPARRKKKKKKKPDDLRLIPGLSNAHLALVGVGLVVVIVLTLGIYFVQKRLTASAPAEDPAVVAADLEKMGALVQRDMSDPERPVISVGFGATDFKGAIIDRLKAFPKLREVNLAHTTANNIDLEHFDAVPHIRVLILSHTKVSTGGMEYLKPLKDLEVLDLASTLVTDVGLEELKGLTKLQKINLTGTLAGGESLRAAIPGLEVIR